MTGAQVLTTLYEGDIWAISGWNLVGYREPSIADNLAKAIAANGGHLSTGFLATPFLLFTLADHGHTDVAYELLLNETYPS